MKTKTKKVVTLHKSWLSLIESLYLLQAIFQSQNPRVYGSHSLKWPSGRESIIPQNFTLDPFAENISRALGACNKSSVRQLPGSP